MVQKYCPKCKDCIPVACKSCPCGHKFAKTVAECANKEAAKLEIEAPLVNRDNGRPKRRSAMNSLYYHSSLQLTSYKLTKQSQQAAMMVLQTRKSQRQSTDSVAGSSTSTQVTNGADTELTNGHAPRTRRRKKKKRGRPRIHPRPEEQETEEEEEAKEESGSKHEQKEEEEPLPPKRNRPHLISSEYMRNGRADSEGKSSRAGRVISESESYSKLYHSLSDARKKHFSIILAEINSKFQRNANFPL